LCYLCVFFFQAEDGIRDFHVTGVQTCALPIFLLCRNLITILPVFTICMGILWRSLRHSDRGINQRRCSSTNIRSLPCFRTFQSVSLKRQEQCLKSLFTLL